MGAHHSTGDTTFTTLIRNTKHTGDVRVMKDTTLKGSPEKIKKQKEDPDKTMKERLEQDEKEEAAAAVTGSQKNSNKNRILCDNTKEETDAVATGVSVTTSSWADEEATYDFSRGLKKLDLG